MAILVLLRRALPAAVWMDDNAALVPVLFPVGRFTLFKSQKGCKTRAKVEVYLFLVKRYVLQ